MGVRQRHFGTGFPLLGREVKIERNVRCDMRRNMLSKRRHHHRVPQSQRGSLTSARPVVRLSSNMSFSLSSSDNEHGPSTVHPSNSLAMFRSRPSGARVTTSRTISPSSFGPAHPGPRTICSTSHLRALSGAKTRQKRSGVLAGGGGVSCAVARCTSSAGGCAMMCASVGERRGVRMRSRSGEWVEKCRTRREGSDDAEASSE